MCRWSRGRRWRCSCCFSCRHFKKSIGKETKYRCKYGAVLIELQTACRASFVTNFSVFTHRTQWSKWWSFLIKHAKTQDLSTYFLAPSKIWQYFWKKITPFNRNINILTNEFVGDSNSAWQQQVRRASIITGQSAESYANTQETFPQRTQSSSFKRQGDILKDPVTLFTAIFILFWVPVVVEHESRWLQ